MTHNLSRGTVEKLQEGYPISSLLYMKTATDVSTFTKAIKNLVDTYLQYRGEAFLHIIKIVDNQEVYVGYFANSKKIPGIPRQLWRIGEDGMVFRSTNTMDEIVSIMAQDDKWFTQLTYIQSSIPYRLIQSWISDGKIPPRTNLEFWSLAELSNE